MAALVRHQQRSTQRISSERSPKMALFAILCSLCLLSPASAFLGKVSTRTIFGRKHHTASSPRLYVSASSSIEGDEFLYKLMDDAVMMWSRTTNQSSGDDHGILELRQRELVDLVEDVAKTIMNYEDPPPEDSNQMSKYTPKESDSPTHRPFESLTLLQITQELDKAILQGYSSSFTENQYEQWVGGVESLSDELQRRMDSGEKLKDATAVAQMTYVAPEPEPEPEPVNPIQALVERFERLETLLGPVTLPSAATVAAASSLPINIVEPDFSASVYVEKILPSASDGLANEVSSIVEKATAVADNVAPIVKKTKRSSSDEEGVDVIMAALSTAAIGAAVATQTPEYAFGIALGPVIKNAIAYAKKKMQYRKK